MINRLMGESRIVAIFITFWIAGWYQGCRGGGDALPDQLKTSINEPTTTPFQSDDVRSSVKEKAKEIAPAIAQKPTAHVDPTFEQIEALPPPVPTMPVVKVKVKDLGMKDPPVTETIHAAFTDADGRLKYLATDKEIIIFGSDGMIKKKVARKKGWPSGTVTPSGIGFSLDGRWVWQSYTSPDELLRNDPSGTEVYDEDGRLYWKVPGTIESLSPNGNKATIVLPEAMGTTYIERGWKVQKDLYQQNGVASMQTCVFDHGILAVIAGPDPSRIIAFNDNLTESEVRRIWGACRIDACLAGMDRVFIDCVDFGKAEAVLFILDSKGTEIARMWFPYMGYRFFDVDHKKKMVLVGASTGESMLINPTNGDVLAGTKRIEGLPEWLPPDLSTNKETLDERARTFNREMKGKFLVYKLILMNGAILRIRKPDGVTFPKARIMELIDFAGKQLFSKTFELEDPKGSLYLPIIWREFDAAVTPIGGKLETAQVIREVRP